MTFKKGAVVKVYSMTTDWKLSFEGRATILGQSKRADDHYFVRFVRPKDKSANDVLGDARYSRHGVERFVLGGQEESVPVACAAGMLNRLSPAYF